MFSSKSDRRQFLRAAGVALSLPVLESVAARKSFAQQAAGPRRRMVAINIGLGLHAPNIIPTATGRDYELPTYLKLIGDLREQFTVFSGVSHPEVAGGHLSGKSFLTAAKHPNSAGFKNTISMDQLAAEQLGTATRFASLSLSSSGPGLSWSRAGVEIPAETRASRIYQKLFLAGKAEDQAAQVQRLRDGKSVLDVVLEKAKTMQKRISGRDKAKLDQYFDAVRETEKRLTKAEAWTTRPKPKVDAKQPVDVADRNRIVEQMEMMYEMMFLAIQTDSTRFLTYHFTGMNAVPIIPGVTIDYHNLSHHGKDPKKIEQLTTVESAVIEGLAGFLTKLSETTENDATLLDQTMVLFGSNLGNASSHDSKNMPMLLAGGQFRHGQHLAFDKQNNYTLANLYLSMLQNLGLEVDSFASSAGTMRGLASKV